MKNQDELSPAEIKMLNDVRMNDEAKFKMELLLVVAEARDKLEPHMVLTGLLAAFGFALSNLAPEDAEAVAEAFVMMVPEVMATTTSFRAELHDQLDA